MMKHQMKIIYDLSAALDDTGNWSNSKEEKRKHELSEWSLNLPKINIL